VLGDQAVLEAAGHVADGVHLHAQLAPAAGAEPRRIEGPAAAFADLGRPPAPVAVHGLDRLRERPDRHTQVVEHLEVLAGLAPQRRQVVADDDRVDPGGHPERL
jgi:hypothetical protein